MSSVLVGQRWRMVSSQDGHRHVSGLVVNEEEAVELLEAEEEMHRAAGWRIFGYGEGPGRVLVARRGRVRRVIEAEAFGPFSDICS